MNQSGEWTAPFFRAYRPVIAGPTELGSLITELQTIFPESNVVDTFRVEEVSPAFYARCWHQVKRIRDVPKTSIIEAMRQAITTSEASVEAPVTTITARSDMSRFDLLIASPTLFSEIRTLRESLKGSPVRAPRLRVSAKLLTLPNALSQTTIERQATQAIEVFRRLFPRNKELSLRLGPIIFETAHPNDRGSAQ